MPKSAGTGDANRKRHWGCDMDRYDSTVARLVGRLNGIKPPDGYAVTISASTTLYSTSIEVVDSGPCWRKHEDCHKRQIDDEGWFKFMAKYLFFCITKGYQQNPYEVEARLAAIK